MDRSFAPVTVPLLVEHDRPFAQFTLLFPDGRRRPTWFWLDTGSAGVTLARELAREVGLPIGEERELLLDWDGRALPRFLVGDVLLDMRGMPTWVARPESHGALLCGIPAEGIFGSWVFAGYRCTFDYPGRCFTLAPPGGSATCGVPLPMQVHPRTRFPRVEVEVAGERLGMLLDTGASFTMISRALIERWAAEHPDWPATDGAMGAANMLGGPLDTEAGMMRLPVLTWGPLDFAQVGMVSRPVGTFEDRMTSMLPAPVVGALAGNVLKSLRIELDYEAGVASVEPVSEPGPDDMDLVGVIVRPTTDGRFFIDAVADQYEGGVVPDIRPGDQLLAVDGVPVAGLRLGPLINLLRGEPGDLRTLRLERDGTAFDRPVPVVRLL